MTDGARNRAVLHFDGGPMTLVNYRSASRRNRSKWNPSQGRLAAKACPEPRANLVLVPRFGELTAHLPYRFGINAKFRATASRQVCQFKMARPSALRPAFPAALRFSLSGSAIIPDLIDTNCHLGQVALTGGVFYPKFIGEDHRQNIADSANYLRKR